MYLYQSINQFQWFVNKTPIENKLWPQDLHVMYEHNMYAVKQNIPTFSAFLWTSGFRLRRTWQSLSYSDSHW